MKVVSTNIGERREVTWKGKIIETGIFKHPVDEPILLCQTDVKNDNVVDRKHHGGIDKACYVYSADHYPFWMQRFPDVDMTFGALGENLTINGLLESDIKIGDRYKVGEAFVEVSQPRQPCMKQGVRFNDQRVVKEFINQPFCGVYLRVLEEGWVNVGDELKLKHRIDSNLSVAEVHSLMSKKRNLELAKKAILMEEFAESYKQDIKRLYQL